MPWLVPFLSRYQSFELFFKSTSSILSYGCQLVLGLLIADLVFDSKLLLGWDNVELAAKIEAFVFLG